MPPSLALTLRVVGVFTVLGITALVVLVSIVACFVAALGLLLWLSRAGRG